VGIAALYTQTGTLYFLKTLGSPEKMECWRRTASPIAGLSWAGLIGILIFIGTVGKSAHSRCKSGYRTQWKARRPFQP
jgi:NADH-quinone oxidoreductase subunit L